MGESVRFVDLFAGLGGFHVGLKRLGHECVLASEIDEKLRKVYRQNFDPFQASSDPSFPILGDIREISLEDVPEHEVLCAGFPCQPFSKAGAQQGLECPRWGDLFDFVIRVIGHRKPNYFILENVPNIEKHDGGRTWESILEKLRDPEWGYDVGVQRLSPHEFGIPQIRKRVFIAGSRVEGALQGFTSLKPPKNMSPNIRDVLDTPPVGARALPTHYLECLKVWQEFMQQLHRREGGLPSFPIWSMEFGATYPYKETTPYACSLEELRQFRGSFGRSLGEVSKEDLRTALPSHALRKQKRFPRWKRNFIAANRSLYDRNREWLDPWIPKISTFATSLQKLEWNCKGEEPEIWRYVLQFRSSGVRVKRPTTAPSLIAMTTTQIPVIAWEKRFMTMRECARLQGMDELKYLPEDATSAFKALGNAVNADLVTHLAAALLNQHPSDGIEGSSSSLSESASNARYIDSRDVSDSGSKANVA